MKLTPHEFQTRLSSLIEAETEILSELLGLIGIKENDFVRNADFSGLDLRSDQLPQLQFEYTNFDDSDMSDTNFDMSNFRECTFKNTVIDGASFLGSTFNDLSLTGSMIGTRLSRSRFVNVTFNGCLFDKSVLSESTLFSCSLLGSRFNECNLRGVKLIDSRVDDVEIVGSALYYGIWEGLVIKNISFVGCNLDESSFLGTRFSGFNIDFGCTVKNTKFSTDCGLSEDEIELLKNKGALFIDDPDIEPHPTPILRAVGQKIAR